MTRSKRGALRKAPAFLSGSKRKARRSSRSYSFFLEVSGKYSVRNRLTLIWLKGKCISLLNQVGLDYRDIAKPRAEIKKKKKKLK